jgi:hypothetical protein
MASTPHSSTVSVSVRSARLKAALRSASASRVRSSAQLYAEIQTGVPRPPARRSGLEHISTILRRVVDQIPRRQYAR